jgi:2,3-bisphosphoglycerate-independent phosphoglycerate mutase
VGLPEGQMGNSEVGHLNLGAGRCVPQDIVRISSAIRDGSYFDNEAFRGVCDAVRARGGTLHLMGLIGNGGVHALDRHLVALIDLGERCGVPVAIHALLDGRDTLPRSAHAFIRELLEAARGRARIASIGGRYFGMDRDRRWPRTEKWYRAAVLGDGPRATDPLAAIQAAYDRDVTDEFIEPIVIEEDGTPVAPMRDGDGIIFFNFRSDRMRQIVRALTHPSFDGFDVRDRPSLRAATMTQYDETFTIPVAFPPLVLSRIMAEVLSEHDKTQFRTAETEKYAHVTYFFNCGRERPYDGEDRLLIPSPKVATYDLQPEMSASGIADALERDIRGRAHRVVIANFANADMVGHTGNLPAAIQAVEVLDACLARVIRAVQETGGVAVITADHGNCEQIWDAELKAPHTAHTNNPVPLLLIDPQFAGKLREGGALCDVAPTILGLLELDQPAEMTGRDLRQV